jgi:tetratricopeptide (TPR) repeat protein
LADANPAVTYFQLNLALSHGNIADMLVGMGKPEEALVSLRKALAIMQKLVDGNLTNTDFQSQLISTYGTFGNVLSRMGNSEEAMVWYHKALPMMQKLIDANPANTGFQFDLANLQTGLGRELDRQKRLAEAFTTLEKALVVRQNLGKADPKNALYNTALGESHAYRGGARVRAGQPAKAAADLRQALEFWAKVPSLDIGMQVERSRALALLAGLGGDVKSGVTKDEARKFADQAVAGLVAVVKTGWAYPSELKEPDFNALRGRDDFKKLLAEVEAKSAPKAKLSDL